MIGLNPLKCNAQLFRGMKTELYRPLPTDWAADNRYLPPSVGTPLPGKWDAGVAPYLNEILNCLHPDSGVNMITLCKGAQIGYTVSVLENAICWVIGANPSPMIYATATEEVLKNRMQLNIDPAIDHAGLRNYIKTPKVKKNAKNRTTGDKLLLKQFAGGYFIGTSLQSATSGRSYSAKILLLDEVDAVKSATREDGDLVRIYMARTSAYLHTRKIFIGSTPRLRATSRVWKYYEEGDQRKYFVPCKKCGKAQVLEFARLVFKIKDKTGKEKWQPDKAYYQCKYCKSRWRENDKAKLLARGQWKATSKCDNKTVRSYHISSLYAPTRLYTWEQLCRDYIDAWRASNTGDVSRLQDFYNLRLGIAWEVLRDTPNATQIELRARGGHNRGEYPSEVIFCTMGVDVQGDRIEAELVGWCARGISYSIDYYVITRGKKMDSVYAMLQGLTAIIESERPVPLVQVFIDSGYSPDDVQQYCKESDYICNPILGRSGQDKMRSAFIASEIEGVGIIRYILNVDLLKDQVFNILNKYSNNTAQHADQAPYTTHFPNGYDDMYYKQLTQSETKKYKTLPSGSKVMRWVQIFHRNEALDCRVYALAALRVVMHITCTGTLGLENIAEGAFWDYAKETIKNT